MAESVYKKLQFVGTSNKSLSDAVANAVAKAGQVESNLRWFEVVEQRGSINNGQIEYQVTINVGAKIT